jgi:hypothetical protein
MDASLGGSGNSLSGVDLHQPCDGQTNTLTVIFDHKKTLYDDSTRSSGSREGATS